eukprot:TRINITY_DN3797_c0_g1_i1.p1 TRINITY_DN3797_c0_g1~~TRINITY_DN3797_c0_g1_i1.p1  ORF type:complete len:300 (-),score=26.63 TRINITY_DN3797_c0_g1_i1:39-938(-)
MRSLALGLFFVLCAQFLAVCSEKIEYEVAILNDRDEMVSTRIVGVDKAVGSITPSATTPESMKEVFRKLFTNKPAIRNPFVLWETLQNTCKAHHFRDTYMIMSMADCAIQHSSNPCTLPRNHYYTWALTDDFELSFGQYRDIWEWGTKHKCLAGPDRHVFAAGEMYISSTGLVKFNIASGTFMRPIVDRAKEMMLYDYEATLLEMLVHAFNKFRTLSESECTGPIVATPEAQSFNITIFPPTPISDANLNNLCADEDVNEPIYYDGMTIPRLAPADEHRHRLGINLCDYSPFRSVCNKW